MVHRVAYEKRKKMTSRAASRKTRDEPASQLVWQAGFIVFGQMNGLLAGCFEWTSMLALEPPARPPVGPPACLAA